MERKHDFGQRSASKRNPTFLETPMSCPFYLRTSSSPMKIITRPLHLEWKLISQAWSSLLLRIISRRLRSTKRRAMVESHLSSSPTQQMFTLPCQLMEVSQRSFHSRCLMISALLRPILARRRNVLGSSSRQQVLPFNKSMSLGQKCWA